jgi:hypothetical protein
VNNITCAPLIIRMTSGPLVPLTSPKINLGRTE